MQYKLQRWIGNRALEAPLTRTQYDDLRLAKERIFFALSMEEIFDILIQNYVEFEEEAISITARSMLFVHWKYNHFQDARRLVNRRLINVMTAARTYLDKLCPALHGIVGDHGQTVEMRRTIESEYRARLGYRAFEALRNYAQHRGLPIHAIGFGMEARNLEGLEKTEFTISISTDCNELKEDPKFKKGILAELEVLGPRIDIRPLLREYISGLDQIQHRFRILTADMVRNSEAIIEKHLREFHPESSHSDWKGGTDLISAEADGSVAHREYIFYDFVEYRRQLAEWNSGLVKLEQRFLTNREPASRRRRTVSS